MPTQKAQTPNHNKKRVIQTGIDYVYYYAYDTIDGVFESFKTISEYYYTPMNWVVATAFNSASAGTKLQEHKNFITVLLIFNRVNSIDTNIILNLQSMITNIDADTLDYRIGIVQHRITFIYEGYDIIQRQPIQQTKEDLSQQYTAILIAMV